MAEQRSETEQKRHETGSEGGEQMPIKHRGTFGGTAPSSGIERSRQMMPSLARQWSGSPFGMMRRMMEDMDRMFEDFGFGGLLAPLGGRELGLGMQQPQLWSPQIEVAEKEGNIVVRADLPGLTKDDIDLELREGALIVRGERREQHDEQRGDVSYSERRYGSFMRAIPVPEGIKPEQVNASFENGVLEITMRAPEATRKRIEIRGGAQEQQQPAMTAGASAGAGAGAGASSGAASSAGRSQPKDGGNQPRS